MSALQITRRKNGTIGYCANRCKGANGLRSATTVVTILGYPQGKFCPTCTDELQTVWDSALEGA
jgi:hypothetical protein